MFRLETTTEIRKKGIYHIVRQKIIWIHPTLFQQTAIHIVILLVNSQFIGIQ